MSEIFMWKEDKKEYQLKQATKKVEEFFEQIKQEKNNNQTIKGVKLSYRIGQHHFARDVMSAIRDNEILLVQAGVGIGKSIGYLIPVFNTLNNVDNFNSVIISTSSIALQQQLLTDINFISNLLNIKITIAISKGINNYACLKAIDKQISIAQKKERQLLLELRREIEQKGTIDREELTKVSEEVWKDIQIKNRGSCSRCNYAKHCPRKNIESQLNKANIIITNHTNFAKAIIDNKDYISNADMFIFDEAHNLDELIGKINEGSINLNTIKNLINYYLDNNLLETTKAIKNAQELNVALLELFSKIRKKANYYFYNSDQSRLGIEITDCDKLIFNKDNYDRELTKLINSVTNKLERLLIDIEKYKNHLGYYTKDHKQDQLTEYLSLFKDMEKENNSENIYWATFQDKSQINIGYISKSNINITQRIFEREVPIVCTSGTLLDAKGTYNHFKRNLEFDDINIQNQSIVEGKKYISPYNYQENSLFYYDPTISNPKNYKQYLNDIIKKIYELISITNGRSLILFTSKSTMNQVYQELKKYHFNFPIMIQGETNNSNIINKFINNINSCLLATGVFWEGIDIAGPSLSNVIITKLPFDTMDAITEYKASRYSYQESFNKIYLNEMAKKMAQGTGRLIRSSKDKGIICCLDSRCGKYLPVIKKCTPYTNFTTNIQDVYDFSNKYINKKSKVKQKRLSN